MSMNTKITDVIQRIAQEVKKLYSSASQSVAGLMSAADKKKLDGIATGAQVNSITGVKGNAESSYRTGNVNITKANIGLGNVDNTADANKSVASAVTCTGNAATATQFSADKAVTLTGDVTGTANSKAGWSVETTLANSGVTAGNYGPSANATPAYGATFNVPYITVDAKGRVTACSTKTVKIPASDNSDTHYTTMLYVGAKDAKSNAVTANGNTYLKLYDNNTVRAQLNIKGSGATTVTTDANGTITISSTDTNTTYDLSAYALKANYLALTGGTLTGALIVQNNTFNWKRTGATVKGTYYPALSVNYLAENGTTVMASNIIGVIGTDSTDGYNTPVVFGSANGTTIVGAGESSRNFAGKNGFYNDETLYLTADAQVKIYTNLANDGTSSYDPIIFNQSKITATGFIGNLTGNATSATKDTQDGNGKVIANTYVNTTDMTDVINSMYEMTNSVNKLINFLAGYYKVSLS